MLTDWQKKFPNSFKAHPAVLSNLTTTDQQRLSELLSNIEKTVPLNKDDVSDLLSHAVFYLDELETLFDSMISLNALDAFTLNALLKSPDLHVLKRSILDLAEHFPQQLPQAIKLSFSNIDPIACNQFILRALKAKTTFSVITDFLTQTPQIINLTGFSRAMTLFDHSHFNYTQNNFQLFHSIASILTNPLSQAIFDARLRSFSDYAESEDILDDYQVADQIIQKISLLKSEETKIHTFFDFFATFRPFPNSQKNLIELDLPEIVTHSLESYVQSQIELTKISHNPDDYIRDIQLIKRLRTRGGNKIVFDDIKYEIAAKIESTDLCSTRNYEQLMDEIWQQVKQPQSDLDQFTDQLEKIPGYQTLIVEAKRGRTLFMPRTTTDPTTTPELTNTSNSIV